MYTCSLETSSHRTNAIWSLCIKDEIKTLCFRIVFYKAVVVFLLCSRGLIKYVLILVWRSDILEMWETKDCFPDKLYIHLDSRSLVELNASRETFSRVSRGYR